MTDDELIQAVAKEVMGWEWGEHDFMGYKIFGWVYADDVKTDRTYGYIIDFSVDPPRFYFKWNPIENISDAWMVVEKMRELGFEFGIFLDQHSSWYCRIISTKQWVIERSDTPHRAICLAALEAVRGEEVETINN